MKTDIEGGKLLRFLNPAAREFAVTKKHEPKRKAAEPGEKPEVSSLSLGPPPIVLSAGLRIGPELGRPLLRPAAEADKAKGGQRREALPGSRRRRNRTTAATATAASTTAAGRQFLQ